MVRRCAFHIRYDVYFTIASCNLQSLDAHKSKKFTMSLVIYIMVKPMMQGVPGAYSEDAALKAYPHCETVPCDEFEDAFKVSSMISV